MNEKKTMHEEEYFYEFDDHDDNSEEEEKSHATTPTKLTLLTPDEKTSETNRLNKDLDALKSLFQLPRLYLSDFFTDLKRDIDLAVMQHGLNINRDNTEQHNTLSKVWVSMVDRVCQFENECYQKCRLNKFNPNVNKELSETITLIETKLQNLTTKEDAKEINELIYDNVYQLEKIIFINKTITFVDKKICKLCELFNEMDVKITFGKLLIVNNQYFGKRGLNFLTKLVTLSKFFFVE